MTSHGYSASDWICSRPRTWIQLVTFKIDFLDKEPPIPHYLPNKALTQFPTVVSPLSLSLLSLLSLGPFPPITPNLPPDIIVLLRFHSRSSILNLRFLPWHNIFQSFFLEIFLLRMKAGLMWP